MLGHTRARLASTETLKKTPSDPALRPHERVVEDGVDRGRPPQSIPPVLPIGFNDVAMLPPQHTRDLNDLLNNDIITASHNIQPQSNFGQLSADGDYAVGAYDDLQSLIGNGNWAPWFQNSVRILLYLFSNTFIQIWASDVWGS